MVSRMQQLAWEQTDTYYMHNVMHMAIEWLYTATLAHVLRVDKLNMKCKKINIKQQQLLMMPIPQVGLVCQLCDIFYYAQLKVNCNINLHITYTLRNRADGPACTTYTWWMPVKTRYGRTVQQLKSGKSQRKVVTASIDRLLSISASITSTKGLWRLPLYQSQQFRAETPPSRVGSGSWYFAKIKITY